MIGKGVSLLRTLLQLRASRISQSHGSGNLVEGLSRRIISGSSIDFDFSVVLHIQQMTVPTTGHQANIGRNAILMSKIICRNMPFNMMYRNQGLLNGIGQSLGFGDSHQKRAYQSGAVGYRHRRKIGKAFPRLFHGQTNHLINFFQMITGSNLRHYPSKLCVKSHLRGNHIGKHFLSVLYHCRCGFITAAFDSQNQNIFHKTVLFLSVLFIYSFSIPLLQRKCPCSKHLWRISPEKYG